ncbi:RagB/SusD family nutrient uptake outer membrane protein [Parabacteroides sp. PF5-6]|uniref:RagB/SusD family nutrient uptake outer membrane protein n=1 Tax=Parabacteroides sp. PF5-6 TaxID=1742403 RepID=UPI0024062A89|nr:RagB/SusD family nutrient uptake outer membrane protein [Parabacteroides sp. PF5-6]MDF9830830.1 hypothetical protein [Parabacteroides sp. PF5-6]
MKKKSIISLILGACVLLSLPSCFNLDEEVYGTIPADNFGKNEGEINAIIGPVYNTLKKYYNNFQYVSDLGGEMSIVPTRRGGDWWDGGRYREMHFQNWTNVTGVLVSGWNAATQSVSSCNLVYETINNSESLTPEAKASALAEIRGVRAFWIYALCEYWGNVPLVVDFKDTDLPTNKPRQEVYNWLVKELNEIKDLCRSDVSAASYGKFTKGAAYTLLAKIYLNAEAWGVDSGKWQQAADACDVVMGLDYVLEPNWKTNFQVHNESSKEAILAACYSAQDTQDRHQMHYRTLHYKDNIALGGTWSSWNGTCALPDYVKRFDTEDPRYHGSFLLGEMIDPATGQVLITAHDRPLIHTVDVTIIPGTERDGTVWGDVQQEDGGRCNKWDYDKATLNAMENDFHIFRLADVYLMKAEALVRMGKDLGEATRLVNAVRERGYGHSGKNYDSVDLEKIQLERKFEFAWECHAHQDDIRFGTFWDARWLKESTKGKDYLAIYPVPLAAWQTNQNLKQNPGYPSF